MKPTTKRRRLSGQLLLESGQIDVSLDLFLSYKPPASYLAWFRVSRSKPIAILARGDKRLDHFRVCVVAIESGELVQPEVVTGKVRVRAGVGIAPQITK